MRQMFSKRHLGRHVPVLVTVAYATSVAATTTSYSASCQVGSEVTTFAGCNSYFNADQFCPPITNKAGQQSCYCNQPYLDSVFDCENELRLCFLNNDLDSTFDEQILSWHSLCDTYVTFSPTTASSSDYTAYPEDFCMQDVRLACASAESLIDECLTYVTDSDTARFSSCTCRPELLRQDYTCEYIGNATCLGTPAVLSSLYGYSGCTNFAAVVSSASHSHRAYLLHQTGPTYCGDSRLFELDNTQSDTDWQ
ncbi:hypothetical protein NKR23_g335 [Pleurostoma richardsiae]|uniref:Uncharacterized protein n=1 Tax=Pleurostoma richardsiae TaxID=41990 RepID=A0AA38VY65_9PEZI|nr:hypothetical protein NKR23_g335 [Pleurostoma richardsiae]